MNALRVLLEYALPIAAALLLIAFFTGLPALKSCLLPGEEPVSSPLPRPGRRGRFPAWLPDLLLVLLIAGAYAVPAFTNLGDRDAPQTFVPMHGRTACLTLEADAVPSRLMLYTGIDAGSYEILYSEDGESWTAAYNFELCLRPQVARADTSALHAPPLRSDPLHLRHALAGGAHPAGRGRSAHPGQL